MANGLWKGLVAITVQIPSYMKEGVCRKAIKDGVPIRDIYIKAICRELEIPFEPSGKKITYWKYRTESGVKIEAENFLKGKVRKGIVKRNQIIGRVSDFGEDLDG